MLDYVANLKTPEWRGYMYLAIVAVSAIIGSLIYYKAYISSVFLGIQVNKLYFYIV